MDYSYNINLQVDNYFSNESYEFFFTEENKNEKDDLDANSEKKVRKFTKQFCQKLGIELNQLLQAGGSLRNALNTEEMKKYAHPKTIALRIRKGEINIPFYKERYQVGNECKYSIWKDPRAQIIIDREKLKNSTRDEIIMALSNELGISEDTIKRTINHKNYSVLKELKNSNKKQRLKKPILNKNIKYPTRYLSEEFIKKSPYFNFPNFLNSLSENYDFLNKKNSYIAKIIKKNHKVVCNLFINNLKQINSEFLSSIEREKEISIADHKIAAHFIIETENIAKEILKTLDKKTVENLVLLSNDLLKKMETYFHSKFKLERKCITAIANAIETKQNFPGFSTNFIRNLFYENICAIPENYDACFENLDSEEIMEDIRLYIIKHWDKKESMFSFFNTTKFHEKFPKMSPNYLPFAFFAKEEANPFLKPDNAFRIGLNQINLESFYREDDFCTNNFNPIWEANKDFLVTKSLNFVNEELSNLSAFTQPILRSLFCKFTERFA